LEHYYLTEMVEWLEIARSQERKADALSRPRSCCDCLHRQWLRVCPCCGLTLRWHRSRWH